MSRLQDVIQQDDRASQPVATTVPVGTLYGVTDEGNIIERSDGSAWQPYSPTAQGTIVQIVNTQTGAVSTGTTVTPFDDTIPQIGEGNEFMTLAITPTSATNKLKIDVVCNASCATADRWLTVALFQDATSNALAADASYREISTEFAPICFSHYMTAGTTSATTFRVRAGVNTSGTTTFNGTSGSRVLGGVLASSITITEIFV